MERPVITAALLGVAVARAASAPHLQLSELRAECVEEFKVGRGLAAAREIEAERV